MDARIAATASSTFRSMSLRPASSVFSTGSMGEICGVDYEEHACCPEECSPVDDRLIAVAAYSADAVDATDASSDDWTGRGLSEYYISRRMDTAGGCLTRAE